MEWVRLSVEGDAGGEVTHKAQPDDPDVDHQRPVFTSEFGRALGGFRVFVHCVCLSRLFRISHWPMLAMRLARRLFHLLAQFRSGIGFGRTLELRLAEWTTEEVVHALILDDDMRLAAIDAFAAYRVFEHREFLLVAEVHEPSSPPGAPDAPH